MPNSRTNQHLHNEFLTAPGKSLVSALRHRDLHTHLHSQRVIGISEELAKACALNESEVGILKQSACFHDLGKIGIPDSILLKPGKLSVDEFEVMKTHSEQGEDIVSNLDVEHGREIEKAIRHHHENYDGNGYPDKLSGEAIPITSRIISIADCYDALTEQRPYKSARTHDDAMEVLREEAGQKSDPYIAKKFESIIKNSSYRVA